MAVGPRQEHFRMLALYNQCATPVLGDRRHAWTAGHVQQPIRSLDGEDGLAH